MRFVAIKYDYKINKSDVDSNTVHGEILRQVPAGTKVLDIGCSSGYLDKYLTEENKCRVTGIEIDKEAAEVAGKYCEKIIVGDIENSDILTQIKDKFDVIILGDVLEHLVNPDVLLKKIKYFLTDKTIILVSVPNIAYWRIRLGLLFGRFSYTEKGILDRSHLRFFSRKTAEKMMSDAGYIIEGFSAGGGFGPRILKILFPRLFGAQFIFKIRQHEYFSGNSKL